VLLLQFSAEVVMWYIMPEATGAAAIVSQGCYVVCKSLRPKTSSEFGPMQGSKKGDVKQIARSLPTEKTNTIVTDYT
jgi:hypothetical protein